MFNYVMKIGGKLSSDEFEARINPVVLRLFASQDRQMRVSLLDNLPLMIDHFSQKLVTDKIFPQIVCAFCTLYIPSADYTTDNRLLGHCTHCSRTNGQGSIDTH